MKTTIWTKPNYEESFDSRSKCIFNGEIPLLLRKNDEIQILEGFCIERINRVYYSIPDDAQEVHLETIDSGNEYPTVDYK